MRLFDTIYNNIQKRLTFRDHFQGNTHTKRHRWLGFLNLDLTTLGLETGGVATVKAPDDRRAIVLSTQVGTVVIYEHLAQRTMLGFTCHSASLRDILTLKYGVSDDHLIMMFGKDLGLDNAHRLDVLLQRLATEIMGLKSPQPPKISRMRGHYAASISRYKYQ